MRVCIVGSIETSLLVDLYMIRYEKNNIVNSFYLDVDCR